MNYGGKGNWRWPLLFKRTQFGQFVFEKIIKIVATRCQFLHLKMHQIRFRLGLHPRSLPPPQEPHPASALQASTLSARSRPVVPPKLNAYQRPWPGGPTGRLCPRPRGP